MFGELIGLWAASVWQQMGAAGERAAGRARPRPRHHDARCAARGAGGAGVPRRDRGASGRDQPGAAAARSSRRSATLDVPVMWHQTLRRGAGRPRHRPRQRILRRAAGEPGDQAVQRLARARGRDRRRRQARVRHRQRRDPAVRPARAGHACATRRSARSSNGAPTTCRSRSAAGWRTRAAPRWSSTTAMSRARPATPCRRSAATPSSIRCDRPGEVDLTAHVDFQALAHAAESMGARVSRPDRAGANSCAVSASRSAPPR